MTREEDDVRFLTIHEIFVASPSLRVRVHDHENRLVEVEGSGVGTIGIGVSLVHRDSEAVWDVVRRRRLDEWKEEVDRTCVE